MLTLKFVYLSILINCGMMYALSVDKGLFTKTKSSYSPRQTPEPITQNAGMSQVLNLNLSNLFLLLILKGIVYVAGFMQGNESHSFQGRETTDNSLLSESELSLAAGYLSGNTCLYQAACEDPQVAKKYMGAAKLVLDATRIISGKVDSNLENNVLQLERAIDMGTNGQCGYNYNCKNNLMYRFLNLNPL